MFPFSVLKLIFPTPFTELMKLLPAMPLRDPDLARMFTEEDDDCTAVVIVDEIEKDPPDNIDTDPSPGLEP